MSKAFFLRVFLKYMTPSAPCCSSLPLLVNMPKETAKRSAKGEKKKTGPKRSLSAYMFFSQANRQKVKDENPDASFGKQIQGDFDAI